MQASCTPYTISTALQLGKINAITPILCFRRLGLKSQNNLPKNTQLVKAATEIHILFCQNPKMLLTGPEHHHPAKEGPLERGRNRSKFQAKSGSSRHPAWLPIFPLQKRKKICSSKPNRLNGIMWIYPSSVDIQPACKYDHKHLFLNHLCSFQLVHTLGWTRY